MPREMIPFRRTRSALLVLDQLLLPHRIRWISAKTVAQVAKTIRDMNVRGAPAIGCVAAYGMAIAGRASRAATRAALLADLARSGKLLCAARPTAVNLAWAVERMLHAAKTSPGDAAALRRLLDREADAIATEDLAANRRMGAFGAKLFPRRGNILTHCNTGALATGGWGTALGVIRTGFRTGRVRHVWVDETRPYLQGARLTAWELHRERIPFTLITDNMAGHFMQRGKVDAVIVGADRITARGDTANKIGTYALAILARSHGLPFYVAAPTSTVDLKMIHGRSIPIEERSTAEVVNVGKTRIAPMGIRAAHPAFDVTPGELITAIITESGVAKPPYRTSLRALLRRAGSTNRVQ